MESGWTCRGCRNVREYPCGYDECVKYGRQVDGHVPCEGCEGFDEPHWCGNCAMFDVSWNTAYDRDGEPYSYPEFAGCRRWHQPVNRDEPDCPEWVRE